MKMMYRNWEKFDKIFMICIKLNGCMIVIIKINNIYSLL